MNNNGIKLIVITVIFQFFSQIRMPVVTKENGPRPQIN